MDPFRWLLTCPVRREIENSAPDTPYLSDCDEAIRLGSFHQGFGLDHYERNASYNQYSYKSRQQALQNRKQMCARLERIQAEHFRGQDGKG